MSSVTQDLALGGTPLGGEHRAIVPDRVGQGEDKADGQDAVEAVGEHAEKEIVGTGSRFFGQVLDQSKLVADPSGYERDTCDGCCRRIDNVAELFA